MSSPSSEPGSADARASHYAPRVATSDRRCRYRRALAAGQSYTALSDFADAHCPRQYPPLPAGRRCGEIVLADPHFPEDQCGYVALAMGKQGGRELNYSSDIDLIIIYEPAQIDYRGGRSHQQFVERLTRHLIAIMQEMTADGYVCRSTSIFGRPGGHTPRSLSRRSAELLPEPG